MIIETIPKPDYKNMSLYGSVIVYYEKYISLKWQIVNHGKFR